jgi:hypothetical protein
MQAGLSPYEEDNIRMCEKTSAKGKVDLWRLWRLSKMPKTPKTRFTKDNSRLSKARYTFLGKTSASLESLKDVDRSWKDDVGLCLTFQGRQRCFPLIFGFVFGSSEIIEI